MRLELEHADDREAGFRKAKEILDGFPEGPDKLAAQRLVTDRIGTTVQFRTGAIPSARAAANAPRVVDAGTRLERNALAGALAHEDLRPLLGQLTPEHFYDPLHRSIREHILDGTPLEPDGIALLAELDARAEAEGIDAATGEELLWRLRERELRRELQGADVVRTQRAAGDAGGSCSSACRRSADAERDRRSLPVAPRKVVEQHVRAALERDDERCRLRRAARRRSQRADARLRAPPRDAVARRTSRSAPA